MARMEEKAESIILNRCFAFNKNKSPKEKRPHLASQCRSLAEAEQWRQQILREIERKVMDTRNPGLGEHCLRNLNDEIDRLIQEKGHWERRIAQLGGPNYTTGVQELFENPPETKRQTLRKRMCESDCDNARIGIVDICEDVCESVNISETDQAYSCVQSSETIWEDVKRLKTDGWKIRVEGSVTYESFSAELFGWPSKLCMQNVDNFQRSDMPLRIMFYDHGEWKDYSNFATVCLCDAFKDGKACTEVIIDGKRYIVDFKQMLQVNSATGYGRSVAWIDRHGKCFFPANCFEGPGFQLSSQLSDQAWHSRSDVKGLDPCRYGAKNVTDTSSVESSSVLTVGGEAFTRIERLNDHFSQDYTLLGDKLIKLSELDHEFTMVQSRFLAGLGLLAAHVSIKAIHKDCHKSMSGQARLQAFKRQEEITAAARGDSNLRYAWHGTSKQGVSGIVLHGFGQPRMPRNGAKYGVGVYLAPEDYAHVSAVYSDVDENGERHMVLCQVIMGNMEQVQQGSEQFHPISEDYDSGIDDISNPKRYVIWSTHMNRHILPQYIVSFKIASPWNDMIAALRGKHLIGNRLSAGIGLQADGHGSEGRTPTKASCMASQNLDDIAAKCESGQKCLPSNCLPRSPKSPWMSFPMLFLVLKAKLPPAKMCELERHYLQFKVGKMSRDELIKVVRHIAGDRLLADSIRSMQVLEKANHVGISMGSQDVISGSEAV